MEKTHIAVVGAGAIGGATAAFLQRAGRDPEVVCRHQTTVDRAVSQGMHVFGVKGDRCLPLRAVKHIKDLSGPKDLVFLATKANDCLNAANDLIPFLNENSLVVSLQNGICENEIGEVIGRSRVVGCVVGWGATMHSPCEIEMTSSGEFVIGNMDGGSDNRLVFLKDVMDSVMPTRLSENILGELYSKLVINSCINSLGVIAGVNLGRLLAARKVRDIFTCIMGEAIEVADAMKIYVEPAGGGRLDFYRFLDGNGFSSTLKRHVLLRVTGYKFRRIKSSSLQSLERGKKTEIDYLNGYICRKGLEYGVQTPVNDIIVEMVKEIENGKRAISMENLYDPLLERC